MAPNAGDDKGNVLLTAAIVCTVLSTLSFLGRIWGRSLSAMKLGWDDLLMTFAMVSRGTEKMIDTSVRLTDIRSVVGPSRRSTYWVCTAARRRVLNNC